MGEADSLFLDHNCVALGWGIGDLSQIPPSRDAFKRAFAATYPNANPRSVGINAGQIYRFVHELAVGDLVVYPSKKDRQIHVGRVTGQYEYNTRVNPEYSDRRSVEWLAALPRTRFTQGALYGVGCVMTFFQINMYADEFVLAAEGKAPTTELTVDDTVGPVADDIEETTRDFVLKRLARELKGHPLAHFVAHMLQAMGYRTRVSPEGPDGGIDIVAHKDELGFEPPIIKVQVKATTGSVGDPVVSALYGKIERGEFGLFVTLSTFTGDAKKFARQKSNLRLIDGDELVNLVYHHYEGFNSLYKGILPLKRVYIPDVIDESGE